MTHRNWKTTLKRVLSRAHVLPAVRSLHYQVRRAVDRDFRASELLLEQEFRQFAGEYGAAFRRPCATEPGEGKRRVLVVSSGSLGQLVEIALVKAFQLAGYRPVSWRIMTGGWKPIIAKWESRTCCIGMSSSARCPHAEAARMMATAGSFEHLIKVGLLTVPGSENMRLPPRCAICGSAVSILTDQAVREAMLPFLHRAISYAKTAQDDCQDRASAVSAVG